MAYLRGVLIFLALYVASAFAFVGWSQGCSPAQSAQLESAIDEAISVANDVVTKLNGFNAQTKQPLQVWAAVAPLFTLGEISTLSSLYHSISGIRTTFPVKVTFYCSENHMRFDATRKLWADTDYSYVNQNGQERKIKLFLNGPFDANTSPGTKGSYTTVGLTEQGVDFSNQAHIFINPARFNPSTSFDTRPFATIRSAGLNPQFNFLDGMKPLSETVFHELLHVVGGTTAPGNGKLKITDGPNSNTYGYENCEKLNFEATLGDPTTVADCITIAAKALFLQIANPQNNPTWWSTGIVDPVTLNSLNVPPQLGAKARRATLSWEA